MSAQTLWTEERRTCLAYSPGGHRAELLRALERIRFTDCFHVTFDDGRDASPDEPRTYRITHPRRSVWRTLRNSCEAAAILLRERPRLLVSTGADVAVPLLLLGRLAGARIVFIETGGTIGPSWSGRLVYPFAHLFVVQWPEKLEAFPRAKLSAGLLL